jgi:hypothetical protein
MIAERSKVKRLIVLTVLWFMLLACNGCATDFKLQGPSMSWRSGAGEGPANAIAGQPIGGSVHFMGSGSAAASSPSED